MDSSVLILVAIFAGAALLFSIYRFGRKSAQTVSSANPQILKPLDLREAPDVSCIRISSGDETVLAEITPVHFPELNLRKTGMPPTPGLAEKMNDLIAPARPMLQKFVAQHGTRHLVRFSKDTMAMIARNEAHLPKAAGGGYRAFAVSRQTGQVVENAILIPDGISKVEKAFMVWELAAIVTLQKYLSDIRKALCRIEVGIQDIRSKLDEADLGVLYGNYDLIKSIANEIGSCGLSIPDVTSYLVSLDRIEAECIRIAKTGRLECQRKLDAMKQRSDNNSDWKDVEEDVMEILQQYCTSEYKVLFGNLLAGGSAHIRCLLSSNPKPVRERVSERLADLHATGSGYDEFKEFCRKRAPIIGGLLSMGKTDRVYRERFIFACDLQFRELDYIARDTKSYLESMKNALDGRDSESTNREIEMTLDSDGKVCEAITR